MSESRGEAYCAVVSGVGNRNPIRMAPCYNSDFSKFIVSPNTHWRFLKTIIITHINAVENYAALKNYYIVHCEITYVTVYTHSRKMN